MYGADWCPDCRRSKRVLDRAGVDYVYRNLDVEPEAADEARALSGRTSIPVVVLPGGRVLVEPSDEALRSDLVASGVLPA